MNNPFSFLSRKNVEASFGILIRRFPLSAIIVTLFSLLLFYFIQSETTDDTVTRAIFSFGITFFFSTGMTLFSEGLKNKKYTPLLSIIPILYGIWVYFTIDVGTDWFFESFVFLLLHLFGFIAFLFFAPYIRPVGESDENEIEYSNYFSLVAWTLLMSSIIGGALLALGFIALGSIFALFDINDIFDEGKLYASWAVIALAFVSPIYGLIHLPLRSEMNTRKFETNKFFSFLIRYVGVPFIGIYFLILYTYSGKVLLNFSDWPRGIISWMVIGFSTFGYLNYIFSKPYETESKMITLFRRYFPFAVIPQILMLFYALYLRLVQYDLTMNRYFVIIFGLWLGFTSLYLIVSKKKSLSIITASLALLSFVISVGPWSVFQYPTARQYTRLIQNLEKANILKNGMITPLASPKNITKELSNEIYSGISYVCDFSECSQIKELFKKEVTEATIRAEENWKKWNTETGTIYSGISKWEIVSAVADAIKVQQGYNYDNETSTKYIQYNTSYQYNTPYPLDITPGYTKIVSIVGALDEKNTNKKVYPYISLDPDTSKITYHRGSGNTLDIPFTPPKNLINTTTPTELNQEDLTFVINTDDIDTKLYFQSYAIRNPEYSGTGVDYYYSISGIGLVKEKR
ncbi:DUF4153 domain-containing protein [Candidatus Gracilibacteria bacterium]|nr:DUF4153 domain-containing protein [Candidatus Gracilibacteria bacterium]